MTHNAMVRLESVRKNFGNFVAVNDIDLCIGEGEFLTLLGPSGCGKTTTLRMIAGLEIPTSGTVYIKDEDVTYNLPAQRDTSIMFQNYALFPHKTIGENIAFGLKMKGVSKTERLAKAQEMLNFIHLPDVMNRKPHQLSGGQCQRVALARSLVMKPSVLLLDEPLGALDAGLRKAMQMELKKIQREVGITFVYVTHDQEEALTMSDRIAVMNQGIIEQLAPPSIIYETPSNSFVAKFVGRCNLLNATVKTVENDIATLKTEKVGLVQCNAGKYKAGDSVQLLLRPEKMRFEETENMMQGKVCAKAYVGSRIDYEISVGGFVFLCESVSEKEFSVHDDVSFGFSKEDGFLLESGGEHE